MKTKFFTKINTKWVLTLHVKSSRNFNEGLLESLSQVYSKINEYYGYKYKNKFSRTEKKSELYWSGYIFIYFFLVCAMLSPIKE